MTLNFQLSTTLTADTTTSKHTIAERFLASRREGLSPYTIRFYRDFLRRASTVIGTNVTSIDITRFLRNLHCTNAGKAGYFRTLRCFYSWLYSKKSGYGLNQDDNPMLLIDPPKVERKILPSLNTQQLDILIDSCTNTRDKLIISLFADSGLRLSELVSIERNNINFPRRIIKIWCKGNKQAYATYGRRTEQLLAEYLNQVDPTCTDKLFNLTTWGVIDLCRKLKARTGLPCNPHTFRRTFAVSLSRQNVDMLHIMRLGRWESLEMVRHYTQTLGFEDSLKLYSDIVK
jgi:site-specific recombinase XerD